MVLTHPELRTVHHSEWPAERIAAQRQATISLCLPARDEAATIGAVLEQLMPLLERDVVDQVLVVDESGDGTGDIARSLGAEVVRQSSLQAALGPVQGKGDAMWRAQSVLTGDVVCYLDADSEDLGPHFACGLVGPLACGEPRELPAFAKSFYRRPFKLADGAVNEHGGGRVTELLAKPMLRRFLPELAAFHQPLSGEVAVRRSVLAQLPMLCGYSVDVALLVDVWRAVGLGRMVQVDLDCRQNRHRPLHELGPMAEAVLAGLLSRLDLPAAPEPAGEPLERPPAGWLEPDRRR